MTEPGPQIEELRDEPFEFRPRHIPLAFLGLVLDFFSFAVGALVSYFFRWLTIMAVIFLVAAAGLAIWYFVVQGLLQLIF